MADHLAQGPLTLIPIGRKIHALPVVHGSVEITVLLRRVFLERSFGSVALELPSELRSQFKEAVAHADSYPVIRRGGKMTSYVIFEPLEPLIEALRSSYELNLPVFCIDPVGTYPTAYREPFPDTYSLLYYPLDQMYEKYKKTYTEAPGAIDVVDAVREYKMAEALLTMQSVLRGPILFVCGIRHLPRIEYMLARSEEEFGKIRDELVRLLHPHDAMDPLTEELQSIMSAENEPLDILLDSDLESSQSVEIHSLSDDSGEVLDQPAYFNQKWLEARTSRKGIAAFDRILLQRKVYREARDLYERESGEIIPPQREKLFFRFARNWSLLKRRLLPDAYRLIVSARAFVNDNFARIFYDLMMRIEKSSSSPFPELRMTLDDLYRDSKLIRFRIKLNNKPKVAPPRVRKGIRREKYPGEWQESWSGGGMCSYPPEDIIIEEFAKSMQTKAVTLIKSNETRILPFSSSLLDGIDYRETIRNAWQDRIFVKEVRPKGSDAGSVVVIFSDDEEAHSWKVVWWGEHTQESDMAFYASSLLGHIVGPGISRCIYGGFLLTYPPGRLGDIWNDAYFEQFEKASDRLLAAAILYNEKNVVVHVGDRPPSAKLNALAGRFGQRIAHFPLSSVNPVQLNRVRRFHVLDGKDRRDEAGDYAW